MHRSPATRIFSCGRYWQKKALYSLEICYICRRKQPASHEIAYPALPNRPLLPMEPQAVRHFRVAQAPRRHREVTPKCRRCFSLQDRENQPAVPACAETERGFRPGVRDGHRKSAARPIRTSHPFRFFFLHSFLPGRYLRRRRAHALYLYIYKGTYFNTRSGTHKTVRFAPFLYPV